MVENFRDITREDQKQPAEALARPATHAVTEDHRTSSMESALTFVGLPRNAGSNKMNSMEYIAFLTDPLRAFSKTEPGSYPELLQDLPTVKPHAQPAPKFATPAPVPPMSTPSFMRPSLPSTVGPMLGGGLPIARTMNGRPHMEPRLENIVSTVDLDCKLDLRKIALQAKNAEYNPKRFAAVIMRIRSPKTTALIFSSGKMVCTGAKTEVDSKTAAMKYAKTIKKLGFDVKFKKFTIQNIVGSCAVDFRINLELLKLQHDKFCTYDPEIFPGLIFRMQEPKIVLLIFCSGKVVLTGAREKQQLLQAFEKIYPLLSVLRIKTGVPGQAANLA